ncbi:hypothetical protein [Methylobacterium sp. E-045]|uniref:hypothetical protein n=1 Tax=Methylobacterium sp. E-045 TaxID=2836575 RepID=UPI001FBAC996|nr:hypothetical protein [Methylobacterium sp. E-045]MCJ2132433.1 hypothetical protein [Methylobacterium sp. E-045]
MNDNGVIRYDIRPDHGGWTVYNIATGEPSLVRGIRQVVMLLDEANDLADALNAMERKEPGSSVTWADGSR